MKADDKTRSLSPGISSRPSPEPGPDAVARSLLAGPVPFVAGAVVYVGLRIWAFWHEFGVTPPIFPDSYVYEQSSKIPLLSTGFWTSWDPWGLPLLYKLLPGSLPTAAPVAQLLVSIVAWLVLAWVVSTFVKSRRLRLAGFVLILGFSLTSLIGQWDGVLLTESLTLSLAALLIAGLLVLLRNPSPRNTALVLVASLAFGATRDANGYLVVILLAPIALALWLHGRTRVAISLILGAALIGGMVLATSEVKRWQLTMLDVVAIRVMPSQSMAAYFDARGMPLQPSLVPLLFRTYDPPSPFVGQPSLNAFRSWMLRKSRPTYSSYLVTHPELSLLDPLGDLGKMIGPTGSASEYIVAPNDSLAAGMPFYSQPGYRRPLPGSIQNVLYPGTRWLAFIAMLVAVGVLVGVWLRGKGALFWLVPVLLVLGIIPYAVLVWDAVPLEIARHALLVGVLGRLGLWLAVLFLADYFLTQRKTSSVRAPSPIGIAGRPPMPSSETRR